MISCINLEEKKINNELIYKPINTNSKEYKIIINSKKKTYIQFKLNTKLINSIKIKIKDNIHNYDFLPLDGLIISGYIKKDKPIILEIDILDLCSRININELETRNDFNNYKNIEWDNIYVINLKRRPERKENIIKQFEKENITKYEFIEGVDGLTEDVLEQFNNIKENTKIKTTGHYGCLLSHIKCIEYAKNNNLNNVMILEDDIILEKDFIKKIKRIKIPEYDMLYLGGIFNRGKLFDCKWCKTNKIMGAYAYIINKNMYNILLEKLKKLENYVDVLYLKEIQNNFKIILLNDMVRTSIDTSDTSIKSKKYIKRIEYLQPN